MLSLLREKDFQYVTVKDICAKAGVNRSTFYLHYENIGDLLVETTQLINEKFVASHPRRGVDIENSMLDELFFMTDEWIVPYLNFIKDNKHVYKAVHANAAAFGVEKSFGWFFKNVFSPILSKYGVSTEMHEYIMDFYRNGIFAVIMRWVNNDCAEPVDFVMKVISTLFYYVRSPLPSAGECGDETGVRDK